MATKAELTKENEKLVQEMNTILQREAVLQGQLAAIKAILGS